MTKMEIDLPDSTERLKIWRDNLFRGDTDVEYIAKEYNQNPEEVKRAKEYLFKNDDLLDVVNAKMWELAKSGEIHPSVMNFIRHEIIQSEKMQGEKFHFWIRQQGMRLGADCIRKHSLNKTYRLKPFSIQM